MLPTELLAVVRWKDNMRPKYSKLDSKDVSTAEAVIKAYAESLGAKMEEIREKVSELEEAYGSFKFVRGLATLVERNCLFSSKASLNPLTARHALFTEACKRGFPANEAERKRIIEDVASTFKVSPEQVEASMYADLDSEMILDAAAKVVPVELLKMYNLSLTQTLLFNSTEMSFTASGNWQRIFRAVKFHGLMYMAYRRNGEFTVRLDGPTSLFKLTRRYGTALAKVVPEILRAKPWRIEAKILRANRLLNFTLESVKHGWLFPEQPVKETYDSMVEEEFAIQFKSLDTSWTLKREAEPVEAGASVMIPDFTFHFGKTRVVMEVVGFWTREYLRRKLEKLAVVNDLPFIVAVDEELACDKLKRLQALNPNIHLVYYKGKIPVKQVLNFLKPHAEAEVKMQAAGVKLALEKPVVTLAELANKHNVTIEAVRRAAEKVETHTLVGETLIDNRLLQEIRKTLEIEAVVEQPIPKILERLRSYNLPDPLTVITYFGYRIKWRGLALENASVCKPE